VINRYEEAGMTGTARALIVFNIGAVVALTALTVGALSDGSSATGQGITAAVVTLGLAPTMQFLLRLRGLGPERWWALCVLIPLTTAGLKAAEQRLLTPEVSRVAVALTVLLLVVSPFMAWRQRRR
jgi:uncharacterized membrane protein YhaH (DUF805 family)